MPLRLPRVHRLIAWSVAVVTVSTLVWAGASWAERTQVDVAWAGALHCSGTGVSSVRVEDGSRVPAMAMRAAMDCRRTARVTNRGRLGIEVDQVTLPFMGPGGGGGVQVPDLEARQAVGADDPVDATFLLRRHVAAGSSADFVLEFRFRPGGCDSDGAVMSLRGLPRVRISALGLHGTRENRQYTAFKGTVESSCDD